MIVNYELFVTIEHEPWHEHMYILDDHSVNLAALHYLTYSLVKINFSDSQFLVNHFVAACEEKHIIFINQGQMACSWFN